MSVKEKSVKTISFTDLEADQFEKMLVDDLDMLLSEEEVEKGYPETGAVESYIIKRNVLAKLFPEKHQPVSTDVSVVRKEMNWK